MTTAAKSELITVRDYLRYAVSSFNAAGLFFGHGNDNAWDEFVYLTLHTLNLPLDRLEPFLDARLLPHEREMLLDIYSRRSQERLPAAYLTHEAWLGEHRFYVDERVIVPRSFIAELLQEQLTPWIDDPWAVESALDLCTGSGCLAAGGDDNDFLNGGAGNDTLAGGSGDDTYVVDAPGDLVSESVAEGNDTLQIYRTAALAASTSSSKNSPSPARRRSTARETTKTTSSPATPATTPCPAESGLIP